MADAPAGPAQGASGQAPTAGAARTASGPRASFWQRFAAAFIDGIIIGVVLSLLAAITGNALFRMSSTGGAAGFSAGFLALELLVVGAYTIYFEGSESGQTVGKRVLNIRVIDYSNGGPIGYGKAALRWIGKYVSSAVCLLGYLWMLWDPEKQTWHDKIANSVVVPTSDYPVSKWP